MDKMIADAPVAVAKNLDRQLNQLLVVDITRGGDDQISRRVILVMKLPMNDRGSKQH